MKKFLVEIFAFVFLLILSVNLLYRIDKPIEVKSLENLQSPREIINLGTSHGWDFDYSLTSLKGMNFNFGANTLFYDLQNYRFLNENGYLTHDAIIVIPVSYFGFGLDENRTDRLPDDSFLNQFYHYLPRKYIYAYSFKKDIELIFFKVQENFLSFIVKNKKDIGKSKKQKEEKQEINLEKKIKELEKHARSRAKNHKLLSTYSSESKNVQYLETLIREIKASNDQAILVTTPYYYKYNENFGNEWLKDNYLNKMNDLASRYNIPYLNYGDDKRFTNSPELFMNSDHLNKEGKAMFSIIFFEDIKTNIQNSGIPK